MPEPGVHAPEDINLEVGQVWDPQRGKSRQVEKRNPRYPGFQFITMPDMRSGHTKDAEEFRAWIRRTKAVLRVTP